jgi:DNA-damage-inducible protein D
MVTFGSMGEDSSNLFHFDQGPNFEDLGNDNGFRFWWASDLARSLGYADLGSFQRGPLNRAMAACGSLSIPMAENFVTEKRELNGRSTVDVKLSRFACYLAAMNSDPNKPAVAAAQAWFAAAAESIRQYLVDASQIERLAIRDEISGKEKSLSSVAKMAGVSEYGYFQNAGYRGMYNMNLSKLKEYKRVPNAKKCLLDYMGKEELAANFFRITQTEAKIKNESIRGQKACEMAAHDVGKKVRTTMQELSNTKPENLPLANDIADTRKSLKRAAKQFKELPPPKHD